MKSALATLLIALAAALPAAAETPPASGPAPFAASVAPADAEVYLISPAEGETVRGPVTVRFGLRGMGVAPAGTIAENTGHHHLLIDTPLPPAGQPIPNDARHLHFGKGQTETTLTLAPGKHTLQLLLGDHSHVPHDPVVASKVVTITVE